MHTAVAKSKYVRISPSKARPMADLIRGMMVEDAISQLKFANTKSGRLLYKTLWSAVANAENEHSARRSSLKIQEIRVDEGPRLKRAKSKSRGGRMPVLKRMSHFTIVVVGTEGVR